MQPIAGTMPEQKFRSTKKRVQPAHALKATSTAAQALPAANVFAVKKEKPKAAAKKPGERIAAFWPVGIGLFLCGFAPEWLNLAQQAGIWAVRFTFPLTLLASHTEIGISSQWAPLTPNLALYAQLPLEGVLTMLTLARRRSLKSALAQLFLVHLVAAFVLWLITFGPR